MYTGKFAGCNCMVEVEDGGFIDSALLKFNKVVKEHGILRTWKMNVFMSREERKTFKKFVRERRRNKKQQRILKALERLDYKKVTKSNTGGKYE